MTTADSTEPVEVCFFLPDPVDGQNSSSVFLKVLGAPVTENLRFAMKVLATSNPVPMRLLGPRRAERSASPRTVIIEAFVDNYRFRAGRMIPQGDLDRDLAEIVRILRGHGVDVVVGDS